MASRRDPEARREAIVEAALELFAERGFHGTSTSEIAKRAGVAEGTIFRHFATKKALLVGVVGPFLRRFVVPLATRTLGEALDEEHDSVEAFLTALYDERARTFERMPRVVKVILQEVSIHPEVRDTLTSTFREQAVPRFVAAIERMQARGLVDPALPPATAMRLIVSVFGGWFLLSEVLMPDAGWDRAAERRASIAVLSRGLAPPA